MYRSDEKNAPNFHETKQELLVTFFCDWKNSLSRDLKNEDTKNQYFPARN